MKRFITLLLAAAMVLSLAACGEKGTTIGGLSENDQEDTVKKDPIGAQYLQDLAVKTAAYPDLPAMPSEAELDEAFSTIDYDKMGAEAYEKAQEKIWEDWDARSTAYYDALKALRSEGTAQPDAFHGFTEQTARALLSGTDNTVVSPANLYLALAMLSETTDGESRAQLLSLLGLDDTAEAQGAGNYIWRNLYGETSTGGTQLASSLWLSDRVPYNEETIETLAQQYLASTFSAPMGEKKTDSAIAEWINENTGGLLDSAAGSIETKPETVMLLLTTLYFKDQWRDEFWANATKKDTFTAANGAQQTVDFMHLTQDRASYYRGENYTVAELRFQGGQAMRFLLPDEGTSLKSLLADGSAVGGLFGYDMGVSLPSGKLIWSVPKFDVSADLELTDALRALGVSDVFDFDRADFSPLVDFSRFDKSVAVTQVQHAARVKIDEKGCEAAAFTAITAECTSAMPEELPVIEMDLDRPFAFLITGVDGLPLFVGTVNTLD